MRAKIRVFAYRRWGDGMASREEHWRSDGIEQQAASVTPVKISASEVATAYRGAAPLG
jgi:hypothetical protein